MTEKVILLCALLSPLAFLATSIGSWFQPGSKPKRVIVLSKIASFISIVVVGVCSVYVFKFGLTESNNVGFLEVGLSIRLDALSMLMLGMIALLSFIIIKFSNNYLDGDKRQGAFIGRLAATIASVQLLVLSGNIGLLFLSWVFTSVSLHRLLIFYHERPGAQIAAKKKFILARLGDACLLAALGCLYFRFETGNLEVIFSMIKRLPDGAGGFLWIELSALFLAFAAILKSAQFPTHGWLIEVMETPTPVSALLHAGLLNAGPFLIIRMAYVMDASFVAPVLLLIIGGITALFASVVYLTQTSIKTALGYSSVGHMGFSLMVCGLGIYPAAMLHLVAHSFYKAHAFLSSGSVIDKIRTAKIATKAPEIGLLSIILGITSAMLLYGSLALFWGLDLDNDLPLLFVGAIIAMGVSRLFTSALAATWSLPLILRTLLLGMIVTVSFFVLESGAHYVLYSQVPEETALTTSQGIGMGILLFGFALIVLLQIISPRFTPTNFHRDLAIHIRNGFYANAWFDRLIGALFVLSPESQRLLTSPVSIMRKNNEPKRPFK
nr:NADH/ubiquinone/plastoquinone (complex i) [Cytophagales bacterium]